MKLSLNWLKDYIDPKLSTEELIECLTMAGLEVEGVETVGGDVVLEMEITPNRPDCLNILGLAREIGAITGRAVKGPRVKTVKAAALKNIIHIEDKKDCSRYIGTLVRDARIKGAPSPMAMRLASMGIKPINNAVDVTNFVLMETGQPLHAFDYDKLEGGRIIVRRAKAGETIVTLDGIERKLDPSILVVADDRKPVAVAGIMGGLGTEITAATKNVLLESAHFEMGIIRRACRSLGLRSDSSYRFERNVNFEGVLTGANRAVDLLVQLTGGHVAGRGQAEIKASQVSQKVKVKIVDIESLLGIKVTASQVKMRLSRLGFVVSVKGMEVTVVPPGNRGDISQAVDVIEEIARMIGFDRMPSQLPTIKMSNIYVDKRPREIKSQIRQVLTSAGLDEIITLSMINARSLPKCLMPQMPALKIFNPLSQDQELMRPFLLPSFLQAAATNINRGQKDLRFFEIGKTYFKEGEKETLGILLTGRRSLDWRSSKKEGVDIFDLKGLFERVSRALGLKVSFGAVQASFVDRSCAATIMADGKEIGLLGRVERKALNNWEIKNQEIYYAEIYLDGIMAAPRPVAKYLPISEFPAIVRDVSLAVKKEITYKTVEETCLRQGGDILKSVHFIEQYSGDKIQSGHKGLVFSCHYQSNARTLREEEVSTVHERILNALIQDLNATRR